MELLLTQLKALADGNRMRIVAALLLVDELCACQIIDLLNVSGATTSRHLALLVQAGLVTSRKQGRWIHYRLSPALTECAPCWAGLREALSREPGLEADRRKLDAILCCTPQEISARQRGTSCC